MCCCPSLCHNHQCFIYRSPLLHAVQTHPRSIRKWALLVCFKLIHGQSENGHFWCVSNSFTVNQKMGTFGVFQTHSRSIRNWALLVCFKLIHGQSENGHFWCVSNSFTVNQKMGTFGVFQTHSRSIRKWALLVCSGYSASTVYNLFRLFRFWLLCTRLSL